MSQDDDWSRREFLQAAGQMGLAVGAGGWLTGCDPEGTGGDAGDTAGGAVDTGDTAADTLADAADSADLGDRMDVADIREAFDPITKPPFVQIGDGEVQLRFETAIADPLSVRLTGDRSGPVEQTPETTTRQVDFRWPPADEDGESPFESEVPDEPGTYTIQRTSFDELEPGADYQWAIDRGDGETVEGSFRAPPRPDAPFTFAFFGDTMDPKSSKVGSLVAGQSPDLVLHGGDIQYQSNPFDTFTGLFNAFADTMALAPMHFCVGNHEEEGNNEFELFYERIFAARRQGSPVRYHSFDYGGIRFVMLDSEADFEEGTDQYQWLEQTLTDAGSNPDIAFPVVVFHRPYFTFSKSSPSFRTRQLFHPLFQQHGVPLVLTGHNHCFERFEADGITYIVDGGGGAGLYPPNANKESVLESHPDDADYRKASDFSHGATFASVSGDGTMSLRRLDADGMEVDRFQVG
jgi:hypothetical protein